MLRYRTQLNILLGIGVNHFAQQFSKLGSMFCFFKSKSFICFSDLGITLPVGLTAHRQIHTNLCAFTGKVLAQTFHNFRVYTGSYADSMLVSPHKTLCFLLLKFRSRRFTLWAKLWRLFSGKNVSTNRTNESFHFWILLLHFYDWQPYSYWLRIIIYYTSRQIATVFR